MKELSRDEHPISRKDIDQGVLNILYRLKDAGYQACLVGGCIRDMLLGIKPKDFDVATNATPEEIRKLFNRCFLIGRRFRLAHVYVNQHEFIEVATFRGPAEVTVDEESGEEVINNNVFGTIEEDAVRRDFTINALFYDIDGYRVLDFVDGLKDIEERQIRMIGDPEERIIEDPVRIIRAAKFSGKLNCSIDPALEEACKKLSKTILSSHPNRRIEELFKIMVSGQSKKIFEIMDRLGATPYLALGLSMDDEARESLYKRLEVMDSVMNEGYELSRGVLMSVLFFDTLSQGLEDHSAERNYADPYKYFKEDFKPIAIELKLTKQEREIIRRAFALQGKLRNPKGRFSKKRIIHHPHFKQAFELFEINSLATGEHEEAVEYWKDLVQKVPPKPKKKKHTKRRRNTRH